MNKEVVILGSLGGNFTQSLSNLNVLFLYPKKKIFFLSEENLLFLLRPGKHTIHAIKNTKVGLIPLGNIVENITTTGLQWNLGKSFVISG